MGGGGGGGRGRGGRKEIFYLPMFLSLFPSLAENNPNQTTNCGSGGGGGFGEGDGGDGDGGCRMISRKRCIVTK